MKRTSRQDLIIIANSASESLGRAVARELASPFSAVVRQRFSDGEIHHSFSDDLGGRDIIIVAATHDDASQQELLDLIGGCHYYLANTINLVIPYLGYSTMEQAKPELTEIPKGITRTRQIFRARPDLTAFIDLHSEAVLHAHDGSIHSLHIQTDELLVNKINSLNLKDFALVSPDYGRSKWVARLAGLLGVAHTAADKDRFAQDKTMVGQVAGVVAGKTAIICDDMIRTGGSIIQTAQRCLDAGARDTILMATHLVLSGDCRQKMEENGIKKVIGTDTYPDRVSDDLLDIYSVAPLVAQVLTKKLRLID
ncbi:MAG: ribose-phosphate diphosphokinase [Thermodesulfobacteriota bacterium]